MKNKTNPATAAQQAPNRKKRLVVLGVILAVIVAAVGIGTWYFVSQQKDEQMEPNAVLGMMPGKTNEQIQDELNRQVNEKTIAFSVNADPVFENGGAQGNILFENPASNKKLTRMELYRDDNKDLLYKSGYMEPGSYVPKAKMAKHLSKGTYTCTAYIYAYRLQSKEFLGKVAAAVTVHVLQ